MRFRGEYLDEAVRWWRLYFLHVVFELEPESYQSLMAPMAEVPDEPTDDFDGEAFLDRFFPHLLLWQLRYHLTDPWCGDVVFDLAFLGRLGDKCIAPKLDPSQLKQEYGLTPLRFELRTWDFTDSTRETFEAQARAAFEQALHDYCDDAERKARDLNFERVPEKRNPEHFRWLARYQVKGESAGDIWRSLNGDSRSRRAVEKAIRDTASDIGLTLLQPKNMRT